MLHDLTNYDILGVNTHERCTRSKSGERKMKKTSSLVMIFLIVLSTFSILALQVKAEPDSGVWVSKANMLQPRKDFAAVTYNGKIYAIGGSDRSGGGTERPTTIVEIYDPVTNTWTSGTALPVPMFGVCGVVIGTKIYVIGVGGRLFSYDPPNDIWSEHAQLPADLLSDVGIGTVDGKIYIGCGSSTYPSGNCWTYCYDPTSDTWAPRAPLPFERSMDSFATLNGKLYAIGGIEPTDSSWVHCTRVDVYDPETDSWELESIARLSVPRTHLEGDTPVVNGKIYVIGGWDGYAALSAVEEYDPTTNSWRTLAPMPTARYALATAVANGKIYVMGGDWGGAGGHLQAVNEEFTPSAPPEELYSLPAYGIQPDGMGGYVEISNSILHRIDMDSSAPGDQQTVTVLAGETISIDLTAQKYAEPGGEGSILQLFTVYSWSPSWPPPSGYWTYLYNGIPGGYPGATVTKTFSIKVPETPGAYYLWLITGGAYNMEDAVASCITKPTVPAHAKIVVTSSTSPSIEKLTSNAEDDFGPSLCVDDLGRPHIAWVRGEANTYDIYYGVKKSSSWDISKVTSLTSHYQFHICLCLDKNGNPHIAALTETSRWDLWYIWWDESTSDWVVESVANGGTQSHRNVVSLAIDSTGSPHIAWAARWGGGLWGVFYAAKSEGIWTIETVSHDDDSAPSIALDSGDNPHVLWNNINYQINQRLRYASRVAGSWIKEDIPTAEGGTGNTPRQLFIDSSDSPHIAFSKKISPGHYELWYGKKVDGSWSFSQIRDSTFDNRHPSIFLDSLGIPYVTWQSNDAGNFDVYLAKMDGDDWEITQVTAETIDEGEQPGPSLFIDSSDNVHLAWYGPAIGSGDSEIYFTTLARVVPWESILERAELRKKIYELYNTKVFNATWWHEVASDELKAIDEFWSPLEWSVEQLFASILPKALGELLVFKDAYDISKGLVSLFGALFHDTVGNLVTTSRKERVIREDLSSLLRNIESVISASQTQDSTALIKALEDEKSSTEKLYQDLVAFDDGVYFACVDFPWLYETQVYRLLRGHVVSLRVTLEANYIDITDFIGQQKNLPEQVEASLSARDSPPLIMDGYWQANGEKLTVTSVGEKVEARIAVEPRYDSVHNPMKVSGKITLYIKKDIRLWPDEDFFDETFQVNIESGGSGEIGSSFEPDEVSYPHCWVIKTFRGYFLEATFTGWLWTEYFEDQPVMWNSGGNTMESEYPPRLRVEGNLLNIEVKSPVNLIVVDPEGRFVGFNMTTQEEINEIPTARYNGPESEPEVISITNPLVGGYKISLTGTSMGPYNLTVYTLGTVSGNWSFEGTTQENQTIEFLANINPEGQMTVNPFGQEFPLYYLIIGIVIAAIGTTITAMTIVWRRRKQISKLIG